MKLTKNRKLIFFDIDGTLITESRPHVIPESTTRALAQLRQNGHICLINTGRTYAALDELIRSIQVDGYVCGCGTNIRLGDQILLSHTLPKALCKQMILALDDCGVEWLLEGEKMMYFADRPYATMISEPLASMQAKLPHAMRRIALEEYDQAEFVKFIMVLPENVSAEAFFTKFADEMAFIDRGQRMFEVIPKAFSKATGMKFLEEYFGIPHEDTIAVGDSTNDISMLEYAKTGILMGGVDEALYRYADYVTTPIEQDGIYNAFSQLGLI